MVVRLFLRYLVPSLLSGFFFSSIVKLIIRIFIYFALMIALSGLAGAISSSIL